MLEQRNFPILLNLIRILLVLVTTNPFRAIELLATFTGLDYSKRHKQLPSSVQQMIVSEIQREVTIRKAESMPDDKPTEKYVIYKLLRLTYSIRQTVAKPVVMKDLLQNANEVVSTTVRCISQLLTYCIYSQQKIFLEELYLYRQKLRVLSNKLKAQHLGSNFTKELQML
jgi:hypothetical protein